MGLKISGLNEYCEYLEQLRPELKNCLVRRRSTRLFVHLTGWLNMPNYPISSETIRA